MGGSVSAIEEGFIQQEIANSAYIFQRKAESGEKIIVGMNKFKADEEESVPVFRVDDHIRTIQIKKLNQLKENRDKAKVDQLLQQLNDAAVNGENLMPSVIEAVENKITLGEIADELRAVFGEYK